MIAIMYQYYSIHVLCVHGNPGVCALCSFVSYMIPFIDLLASDVWLNEKCSKRNIQTRNLILINIYANGNHRQHESIPDYRWSVLHPATAHKIDDVEQNGNESTTRILSHFIVQLAYYRGLRHFCILPKNIEINNYVHRCIAHNNRFDLSARNVALNIAHICSIEWTHKKLLCLQLVYQERFDTHSPTRSLYTHLSVDVFSVNDNDAVSHSL